MFTNIERVYESKQTHRVMTLGSETKKNLQDPHVDSLNGFCLQIKRVVLISGTFVTHLITVKTLYFTLGLGVTSFLVKCFASCPVRTSVR